MKKQALNDGTHYNRHLNYALERPAKFATNSYITRLAKFVRLPIYQNARANSPQLIFGLLNLTFTVLAKLPGFRLLKQKIWNIFAAARARFPIHHTPHFPHLNLKCASCDPTPFVLRQCVNKSLKH